MDHHTADGPQPESRRLITLDALRGFALLGILIPNIYSFGWPVNAMTDPTIMGETWWNNTAHSIMEIGFLGKFMFNFGMLFGAGVVMFDRKTTPTDRPPTLKDGWQLWYRRCAVLLAFGILHAYLFWFGDILVWYAVSGLTLIWWVRKLPVKLQIWGGLGLYLLGALVMVGSILIGVWAVSVGHVTVDELGINPDAEINAYLGTWWSAFAQRFITSAMFQLFLFPLFLPALWGIMTLGMGLTRAGILTGQRSTRFHATLCASMLALGAVTTGGTYLFIQNLDLPVPSGSVWQGVSQAVGVPLAIGYSQLVVLACRAPALRRPIAGLAHIGRMAMTNYLLHTLICTTLFYGYGLGLYASIPYPQLYAIVLAVWIVNFVFSAFWLRHFRYGPFEWLWRRLTYAGLG